MHEFVDRVQRIVEGANFSMREYNLKLDDVINEQRGIIFGLRNKAVDLDEHFDRFLSILQEAVRNEIDRLCPEDEPSDEWQVDQLAGNISALLGSRPVQLPEEVINRKEIEEVVEQSLSAYVSALTAAYQTEWDEYIKRIILSTIDRLWVEHLENMTRLKKELAFAITNRKIQ